MKYIALLFLVFPTLIFSQNNFEKENTKKPIHASINSSGGEMSGNGGTISYSLGQVFYTNKVNSDYQVSEGVQQPQVIIIEPVEEKLKTFKVTAYPNPVTNYFTIEASNYNERSLGYHLMDLTGRLIQQGDIDKSGARVDISNLPVAIYLLVITDNGHRIKTIKIIKN